MTNTLTFQEYLPLAMRTCKELPHEDHITHMVLGIIGEVGELVDAVKRHYIYGKPLDIANVKEEIGDLSWYVAGLVGVRSESAKYAASQMESFMANPQYLEGIAVAKLRPAKTVAVLAHSFTDIATDILECNYASDFENTDDEGAAEWDGLLGLLLVRLHQSAAMFDIDLGEALYTNIQKLSQRYGDKYSDFSALNRDLEAERTILEAGSSDPVH